MVVVVAVVVAVVAVVEDEVVVVGEVDGVKLTLDELDEDEKVVVVGVEESVDGVVQVSGEMIHIISLSIISQILIKYNMNFTLDSIVWDNATPILSSRRLWLRVSTLVETTFVPSSTKKAESFERITEKSTTVTAVETLEKSKFRVAMTKVCTLRRMLRDFWNAVRASETSDWLEEELTDRAGTEKVLIAPVLLSSCRSKVTEESEVAILVISLWRIVIFASRVICKLCAEKRADWRTLITAREGREVTSISRMLREMVMISVVITPEERDDVN